VRSDADACAIGRSDDERTVGLTDDRDVRVESLSGGQVQRLAIACAIVHDPALLFLDEPSAGLDPQSRVNLWSVVRSVRDAGKTVVLTTHHMEEAEALCDRVAISDHGRILASDAPARLVRTLDIPVQVRLPSDALSIEIARGLPGAEQAATDGVTTTVRTRRRAEVLRALDEHGCSAHVEVGGGSLEDVFFSLTGRTHRS
jgi:ABC-2 type transport system ATP-binding protein